VIAALRRILLVAVCAAVVTAVAAGWLEDPPPVSAADAVAEVGDALAAAGLAATVDPAPLASSYQPAGGERTDVWQTFASVEGGTILVSVAQLGGRPVFLDDRSPNGSTQLLSEAQFDAVIDRIDDPGRGRLVRRNVALTVAAALVLAVAVALTARPPSPEDHR
jgi:hypothetical protein